MPPDSAVCYDIELVDWREGPEVENDDFNMHVYKEAIRGRPAGTGRTADYRWSEGGEEVTLWVPLPDGCTSKDVRCTFASRELTLEIGEDGPRVGGKLKGRVLLEDCYWVIDDDDVYDGVSVQVVLGKASEFTRWDGVLVDEKEIDTSKIFATSEEDEAEVDPKIPIYDSYMFNKMCIQLC